jgi:hypothetical protein
MFTEQFPCNVRLLWFHYSGFQASCHNIYIDKVIKDWLQVIKHILLFADDQALVASAEDELQTGAYTLSNMAIIYNLKISVNKTKARL